MKEPPPVQPAFILDPEFEEKRNYRDVAKAYVKWYEEVLLSTNDVPYLAYREAARILYRTHTSSMQVTGLILMLVGMSFAWLLGFSMAGGWSK